MHSETNMHSEMNNGRPLGAIISDMKEELKDFVQTRLEMLKVELQEKVKSLKVAAPLAAIGIVLLSTAYLLFTLALVAVVTVFFKSNPYRWFFGFAAVGIIWTILGVVAAYFAKREFELKSLLPERTVKVLKGDKVWIQAEAKNQL